MNSAGFVKYAGTLLALAICSACASQGEGGGALAPANAMPNLAHIGRALSVNGRLITAARPYQGILPRLASILPDATGNKFEYVINDYTTYASIFDYPKSTKQIGTIKNVGGQGCTNVYYGFGNKYFWIMASDTQISEYAVEKKLIRSLSDTEGQPSSCAMNSNGDLAVGSLSNGDVIIFKHARGKGKVYTTPLAEEFFDGYDSSGNLFADGFNHQGYFEFIELAKGSGTFQQVTLSNTISFPGAVQWDGTYLTVLDQDSNTINQYTISGYKATLEGTVTLSGASDCAQTWIATPWVFCGDAGAGDGSVYKYPAGGSSIAVFTGNFDLPLGVVAAQR